MKERDFFRAPLFDALKKHLSNRVVPFDVPGHKGGRGNRELSEFLGETCMKCDVNSMKPLDNLCNPEGVIKEAQALAAEAFGAKEAFFIVNGTTAAVQAMIMYAVKPKEKIILPRNVHRSVINALVVGGGIPVYLDTGINEKLGIALGVSAEEVERKIKQHPDAKAVLINNPTYYGICSDIKRISEITKKHNMLLLADEAHGAHFYFGDNLPLSAMAAGADLSAVSMHKTGGSLTQSSVLLARENVNADYLRQIINLTQTTSASYLLMLSLDLARKNLQQNGKEIFKKTLEFVNYAREEINGLGGYYAFADELIDNKYVFDFDKTKLSVYTRDIGLAGREVYDILRDDYNIQIEFGDIANILAIISAGDRALEIERLISALFEIKRLYSKDKSGMFESEYIVPKVVLPPQQAFYSDKISLKREECAGKICSEFVMCYPPGIPILAPGEEITDKILEYISYAKDKGCQLLGTEDIKADYIKVLKE